MLNKITDILSDTLIPVTCHSASATAINQSMMSTNEGTLVPDLLPMLSFLTV